MIWKDLAKRLLARRGYALVQRSEADIESDFWRLYRRCREQTTTSVERMYVLYKAVEHVVCNDIQGSFVECGVWRGGSSMMAALALRQLGVEDRELFLYDTFKGMTEPSARDVSIDGESAGPLWQSHESAEGNAWCFAPRSVVETNMSMTGYEAAQIRLVEGPVEETIPRVMPEKIAILRLDTDWYESTLHELKYLFPRLVRGGILIIDDYGHWHGARRATDEYFANNASGVFLARIDYTGRVGVRVE